MLRSYKIHGTNNKLDLFIVRERRFMKYYQQKYQKISAVREKQVHF